MDSAARFRRLVHPRMRWLISLVIVLLSPMQGRAADSAVAEVRAIKVTVLSTMLAEKGLGEWGFAALVEVDGRRILFDTGAHTDVVLKNAELEVDTLIKNADLNLGRTKTVGELGVASAQVYQGMASAALSGMNTLAAQTLAE